MSDHGCEICGDGFAGEKGLRDHTWDAHGSCHHCGEPFDDRAALYTHWLDAHEAVLSARDEKRARNKVGVRTLCPVCEDRCKSLDAVRAHARDAHGACHRCGAAFDEEDRLYAHWLGAHGDDLEPAARDRAASAVGSLSFRQRLAHQGPVGAVGGITVPRRTVLGGVGALAVAGVGGYIVDGILSGAGGSLDDHPSASGLDGQPVLGPAPADADATIIAFEDPSCPSCARFEARTFPRLKRDLIDTGQVGFVFRGIPVLPNPWAEPASHALEATYARSDAAFWALKDYYFRNQRGIDRSTLAEETQAALAGRTDVDPRAVIADVDEGTYEPAVRTDLRASEDAGVRGTPTFFLFRDGSYRTKIVGPESYRVFADSLGF